MKAINIEHPELKSVGMSIPLINAVSLHCDKHGDYTAEDIWVNGKCVRRNHVCPKCAEEKYNSPEAVEERMRIQREQELLDEQRRKNAEQEAFDNAFRRSYIPDEFHGKLLKDVRGIHPTVAEAVRQAKLYVKNFESIREKGTGFCFYGSFGTGKTMTACAILQELMPEVEGYYIPLWDMIKAVKRSEAYQPDTTVYDRIISAPLLVVDEIGLQNGSSFEEDKLMQVIDVRVSRKRPTIFCTNLVPESNDERMIGLIDKIGSRLFNRIKGRSVFLLFDGESQRKRIKSIDEILMELE